MADRTDAFTYSNGALDSVSGGNWTTGCPSLESPAVSSNQVTGGSAVHYTLSYYSGATWNAAHRAKLTCVTVDYVGPSVRVTSGGDGYTYFNHGSVQRMSWNGSIEMGAEIATRSTYGASDTADLDVSGSSLQCYKNGATDGAAITDATYSGGAPGLAFFVNTALADNWEGTGVVGGGFVPAFNKPIRQAVNRAATY